jgi:hypothetical protein
MECLLYDRSKPYQKAELWPKPTLNGLRSIGVGLSPERVVQTNPYILESNRRAEVFACALNARDQKEKEEVGKK